MGKLRDKVLASKTAVEAVMHLLHAVEALERRVEQPYTVDMTEAERRTLQQAESYGPDAAPGFSGAPGEGSGVDLADPLTGGAGVDLSLHGHRAGEVRCAGCADAVEETAREVMAALEKYGGSIVPHLLDTDDNAGQRLREALDRYKEGCDQ